jgi:GTP cyclohydrolase-4
MSESFPDVQAEEPDVTVGLNHVGVTNVTKLVEIAREDDRPLVFAAEFEAYVDLPLSRKGADMSRLLTTINEVLESAVAEPDNSVESLCGDAASQLLEKHEYTERAEVTMEAEYIYKERTPASDQETQKSATITGRGVVTSDGRTEKVGVTVTGMTVCPCSQEMSTTRARETLQRLGIERADIDTFLEEVPQPGHSQRGHATLAIETEGTPSVEVDELIEVALNAMSGRIYNLAKRPDEDAMTYESHAEAKFVEDCVRSMAEGVVNQFGYLPDDATVEMEQINEESIHEHDVCARQELSLETLRSQVNSDTRFR